MSRPKDWHPLADSDPVPGDVYEIRQLAKRYADTAEAINTAAAALDKIHDSGTVWESEAGKEFKSRTRETASSIRKAFKRYDETAKALSTYANELDGVQDRADKLLLKAQTAQDEADTATKASETATPEEKDAKDQAATDAVGVVTGLKGQLGPIRHDWDEAGKKAANKIDDVIGDDGLEDGFWDDFDGFVGDVVDFMGKLSAVLGVLALICSFIPFLAPLAGIFAALALITGAISLLGNTYLYSKGKATLGDVLWDAVGVLSFGAGRALTMSAKALVKAGRGLAKPQYIRALRSSGMGKGPAKAMARSRGVTGGGREAKQLAREFKAGRLSWVPKGSDWKFAFGKPFKPITPYNFNLADEFASLPQVSLALRQSQWATRGAFAAGISGNIADGHTLGPWAHVPSGVPIIGEDKTPVER